MKTICQHPYCDTTLTGNQRQWCSASCRISYHQNHRARFNALAGVMVKLYVGMPGALEFHRKVREAYRAAHGYEPRM
jgi:hypothetical protein